MLFNKNENKANERILYKTKSNMVLGCKNAIFGLFLLIFVLCISPMMIKFIGKMQVYLISQIQLPLTRYAAIAFFVIILIIVIYIIWQIIGWYSLEYVLTDSRIIIKSGVISTKKNYMPYANIQDVNTSQSILARLFRMGTISVFSAYDNNQLELKNISNPSEVENIIFSYMRSSRNFQPQQSRHINYHKQDSYLNNGNYLGRNEIYDDFEPITPINPERNRYSGRDYEYYSEDLSFENSSKSRHEYEYEPYIDKFGNDVDGIVEEFEPQNDYSNESYHANIDDYSYNDDNYYDDIDLQIKHDDNHVEVSNNDQDNSSEKVIKRHFEKFKK